MLTYADVCGRMLTSRVLDKATPITMLLDSKSASASEVLAGALRDNCRAVILGKHIEA